jgi:hypothetical protein
LGDFGVDGRVILNWLLKQAGGKMWIGFIWLGIGTSNEPSGSINCGEFLD